MKRILFILFPLLALSLPVLFAVASRDGSNADFGGLDHLEQNAGENTQPPRVVVDQATHDFGTMDPLKTGSQGNSTLHRGFPLRRS